MKVTAFKVDMNELNKAFMESPTIQSLFTVMSDCEKMVNEKKEKSLKPACANKAAEPEKDTESVSDDTTVSSDNITKYRVNVVCNSGCICDSDILSRIAFIRCENNNDTRTTIVLKDMRDIEFYEFVSIIKSRKLHEKYNIFYSIVTAMPGGPSETELIKIC